MSKVVVNKDKSFPKKGIKCERCIVSMGFLRCNDKKCNRIVCERCSITCYKCNKDLCLVQDKGHLCTAYCHGMSNQFSFSSSPPRSFFLLFFTFFSRASVIVIVIVIIIIIIIAVIIVIIIIIIIKNNSNNNKDVSNTSARRIIHNALLRIVRPYDAPNA
jgi:hypothetical protein